MALKTVKIVNCKKASIRSTPWIPWRDEDIVGVRDGPNSNEHSIKIGSTITIDTDVTCYDWTDRKFYKVSNPDGWIYEGCIDYGDDVDV